MTYKPENNGRNKFDTLLRPFSLYPVSSVISAVTDVSDFRRWQSVPVPPEQSA